MRFDQADLFLSAFSMREKKPHYKGFTYVCGKPALSQTIAQKAIVSRGILFPVIPAITFSV
jgi:hypothetical protein